MGSYFSTSDSTPSNFSVLVIRFQHDYNYASSSKVLKIQSHTPNKLYDECLTDPQTFLMKYGYTRTHQIASIEVYGEDEQDLDLLYKVAHHINLDTKGIQNNDQLKKLIEDHIKYSPPNTGFYEAKDHHNHVGKKYYKETEDQ